MRFRRAFISFGRFLDQYGRRRRLEDKAKAVILKCGNDYWNSHNRLHILRLRVKRRAEFHNIPAALAKRRADRRRWIGFTRGNLQFDEAANFFCHIEGYCLNIDMDFWYRLAW